MIHKSAVISSKAKIAAQVSIGPYAVIEDDVEIGTGTVIGAHTIISGNTKIGKNNKIFPFTSIGTEPQHKQYAGEPTGLEIGDNNVIREYCSIHRGTVQGHGFTKIGNDNFLMAYTHIAHDCILGNDITFANNATLAGHVTVGDHVGLGGFVKVLQFCSLGPYSFISGDTDLTKDVLPFVLVSGLHGEVKTYGLNLIGLKRHGFSEEKLKNLKQAYNIICRTDLPIEEIILALEAMLVECPEAQMFIDVLRKSKRGVVR